MDKFLKSISFELTRRCNLQCRWCMKGEAQNVNMSKDIIDKTLDEIAPYYIYEIMFTGGEPSLMPELVEYTVDEIIRKKIKLYRISFVTNGTITSEIIKRSIYKMLAYADDIEKERQEILDYFCKRVNIEKESKEKAWFTVLSTIEHDNKSTFQVVKDFYNSIENELYVCADQNDLVNNHFVEIMIEGNAENYKNFKPEEFKYIRVINHKYCVINDDDENITHKKSILKEIGISAKGEVFLGCSSSYEHIKEYHIFNIMDCHNDFWERIDSYCWEHPIFRKANERIEEYKALKWKKEHLDYLKDDSVIEKEKTFRSYIEAIYSLEKMQKIYHKKLPCLNHYELNNFCAFTLCVIALDNGCDKEVARRYLLDCTGIEDLVIDSVLKDKKKMLNIVNGYIAINDNRENELE